MYISSQACMYTNICTVFLALQNISSRTLPSGNLLFMLLLSGIYEPFGSPSAQQHVPCGYLTPAKWGKATELFLASASIRIPIYFA